MKKSKWIVKADITTRKELEEFYRGEGEDLEDYDFEDFSEVEISVVRKDNEHGQRSGGWGGMDKIILFGADDYEEEDIKWCKKVAEVVCDALNSEGL